MAEDQHCSDVRSIAEDNEVLLTLDNGEELEATCVGKDRYNDETGPNIIQQDTWYFESEDGTEYSLTIIDGLSGTPGESPFPSHAPLFKEDDETTLGYVTEVSFESEPTGADPDGSVDTAKP